MFSELVKRLDTLINDYSRSKTNVISGIHLINDHKAAFFIEHKRNLNCKSYMEVEKTESRISVNFRNGREHCFRAIYYDPLQLASCIYTLLINDYLHGAYVESTEHSQKQID